MSNNVCCVCGRPHEIRYASAYGRPVCSASCARIYNIKRRGILMEEQRRFKYRVRCRIKDECIK